MMTDLRNKSLDERRYLYVEICKVAMDSFLDSHDYQTFTINLMRSLELKEDNV